MFSVMWRLTSLLVLILQMSGHGFAATPDDLTVLDNLLKNNNYDRRATPTNHLNNTTPTRVYMEFFVRSFSSPSPLTMDYKVDLFLRQKWRDERLKSAKFKKPLDLNDPLLVKAIWKPEVYFPNAKEADFQFVTVPNVLVRIEPNGDILYMLRLRVVFSCTMDLSKFPLDRQVCTMEVASFSKTVEELILEWKPEDPITIYKKNIQMSMFELIAIVPNVCNESFQIGNYSCLVAEFHLHRLWGFHLVQSYLPTILMVVISWVSFWMDVNSVPGRVTLGITTLLTVSSKATNVQENIESSYVKAIDIWFGTCTAFVFLALLEFTVVNYLWRKECNKNFFRVNKALFRAGGGGGAGSPTNNSGGTGGGGTSSPGEPQMSLVKQRENKGGIVNHVTSGGGDVSLLEGPPVLPVEGINVVEPFGVGGGGSGGLMGGRGPNYRDQAKQIDETCRYLFPLAFTAFMITYWTYYLVL